MQNKLPSKYLWLDVYIILTDQRDEFYIIKSSDIDNDNNLFIYQIPSLNKSIYGKLNKLISSYAKKNANYTIEFLEGSYQWQISFFEEKSNEQYLSEMRRYYKAMKKS